MGGEAPLRAPSSYPKLAAHPVGQHIKDIYIDRLRQFTANGQYERQNLVSYARPFHLPWILKRQQRLQWTGLNG
jgi:hypothetical protein